MIPARCCKIEKCNMPQLPDRTALEGRLLAELEEIERRIADLEGERSALRRMIMRIRQQNLSAREVTRKNSLDRVLVEKKILETLGNSEGYVRARQLLLAARSVDYSLKDVTFRSYIYRLKEKGLIESGTIRGYWRLVKKPTS